MYFCIVNVHKIRYKDTSCFSKLVENYTEQTIEKQLFNRYPDLSEFSEQINEKSSQNIDRELLHSVLLKQNETLDLSDKSERNIEKIKHKNTFTITTGHQLCTFTGPLYFIYKILSTINLTEKLQESFPEKQFIPIFWMVSEDHDFLEVNHVNIYNNKYEWKTEERGMVGDFNTKQVNKLIDDIFSVLGKSEYSENLMERLRICYDNHSLSEATRFLVNELFGKYGIVILDANDKDLKKKLIPIIKEDVINQSLFPILSQNTSENAKLYKTQANVREINFFKLSESDRTRIDGNISELEIEQYPERFSPNVLIRPLYQELILPNLAYIGGGAEISYWMQLKSLFKVQEIVFPVLVLRNSVMWIEETDYVKWTELGFEIKDIFQSEENLHKKFVLKQSSFNLQEEKSKMINIYESISEKVKDNSMKNSISSESKKHLNSLQKLEKKLLKLEKEKYDVSLRRISKIKQKLFPNNILQERFDNIIPYYTKYGEKFIATLKAELDPLDTNFLILSPQNKLK